MADTAVLAPGDESREKEPSVEGNGTASLTPPESIDNKGGYENFKPGPRVWLAFMTLCVLTLMVALDGTSISVALPIIARALNGTALEAFWSGTSFLLCSTVFQPSFASFSNIFGRKPMILTALVFFLAGSILAAVSENFTHLLIGRSIQGVGGGGLIALTEIVVTDLVPLRLRGQYFGIISSMWSLGSVLGPVLGGGFAEDVSWRWIFYINLPFIGIGGVFVIVFLKLNFIPTSLREKLQKIDYIGTVIFVGSATSFLIPVTWGGVMYEWDSWRTLVPLLIGVAGLTVFMFYEGYVAQDPIIPPSIFSTRTAIVNYAGTILHGLVLWCGLYYMPLYFLAVKEFTPIMSGVALFPQTFTVAPSAALTGFLITATGHYRLPIWVGWAMSTFGCGLVCYIKEDTSTVAWIFLLLVEGFGLGILFPSLGFAIQASAKPKNLAIAVAMFSFFRAFGQAIGVAVGGVVFQNQMRHNVASYPALAPYADSYSADAAGLVEIIRLMPDGDDKHNLKVAYTDSLRIVWAVCCGVLALGGILSAFTESYDLNQAIDTDQGLREEKKASPQEEEGQLSS
ncbi:hypothetical protein FQN54_003440 [Arachnomyces sp. PD_36]|nr:hypothetical protein FQN54_003440 [Arachnomyces sp. PD_36]